MNPIAVLEEIGERYPVMQAGAPSVARAELAAAVARAGGAPVRSSHDACSCFGESWRTFQRPGLPLFTPIHPIRDHPA